MEEALATVVRVLHDSADSDEATRTSASGQLLAFLREPGFAGILSVRLLNPLICHLTHIEAASRPSNR